MPHGRGGENPFTVACTFNDIYSRLGKAGYRFRSTTGEEIKAIKGSSKNGLQTIVFKGENVTHGNVCEKCWGFRTSCTGTRIGQCTEAIDNAFFDPKEFLKPREKLILKDLVEEAGIDTSAWADYKGGPGKAASNPAFCYEWSFVDDRKRIVLLNLWYEELEMDGTRPVFRMNLRKKAKEIRSKEKISTRERRATKFDSTLKFAYFNCIRVRVIMNAGHIKEYDVMGAEGSKVDKRLLDSESWTVSYDEDTGDCILSRGSLEGVFVDQFDISKRSVIYKDRFGKEYKRSPFIRAEVLARAKGKCEFCGRLGFELNDGRRFLESHHIDPLSEGGEDHVSNVIALCPNDHREAHFGKGNVEIRKKLKKIVLSTTT